MSMMESYCKSRWFQFDNVKFFYCTELRKSQIFPSKCHRIVDKCENLFSREEIFRCLIYHFHLTQQSSHGAETSTSQFPPAVFFRWIEKTLQRVSLLIFPIARNKNPYLISSSLSSVSRSHRMSWGETGAMNERWFKAENALRFADLASI